MLGFLYFPEVIHSLKLALSMKIIVAIVPNSRHNDCVLRANYRIFIRKFIK